MVETVIDPVRVPTISLSAKELDQIQVLIDEGKLPSDFLERHFDAVDANVFGEDAPKDRNGFRIGIGIGSPLNQSENSIKAYQKFHGPLSTDPDPDYEKTLALLQKQLAESNAARAAKAPTGRRYTYGRPA